MDDWESEDFVPTLNLLTVPPPSSASDGKVSPPPPVSERAESVHSEVSDKRTGSVAGDDPLFDGVVDIDQSLEALVKFMNTKVKKEKRMNLSRQFIDAILEGGVADTLTLEDTIELVKKVAEKRNKIQATLKKIKEEQERQARLNEDMYDEDLDYQYESYDDAAASARMYQAERSASAKASRAAFTQNKAAKK